MLVRALRPSGTPSQRVGPPHARMQACCAWVRSRYAPLRREPCWPSNGLKQGTAPKADQLHKPLAWRHQTGQGALPMHHLDQALRPPWGCKANTGGRLKYNAYKTIILTLDVHRQSAYTGKQMILSYRDKKTEGFASGTFVKAFQGFEDQAAKRLAILNAAPTLETLRALPSNRLEALRGDRAGQYSIRINQQWRICFEWLDGQPGPSNVEIIDYH